MTQFKLIRSDLIHEFPELNLSNYSDDDVRRLNQWGIDVVTQPVVESEPVAQSTATSQLWECLGRWSAYLVSNGESANMSPPKWLTDAVRVATTPPSESARIAELEGKLVAADERIDKLAGLLKEARDDVANGMEDAKQLLPYKPHRYDMYVEQLASIDEALNQIGEA